jgi:hypothetical protein
MPDQQPERAAEAGACTKCGKPITLFDGTWAHSSVFDFLICAEVKAVPGCPASITSEDFAARMDERSREALRTKDWGTT